MSLDATPLGGVSVASILLAPLPLAVLPAPAGGWCAMTDCNTFDAATATLVDLELGGVDTTAYFEAPLRVTAPTPRAHGGTETPLAGIRLADFAFAESSLGDLHGSEVAALLTGCDGDCTERTLGELRADSPAVFGTATVGDLLDSLPADPGVVLGEVIGGAVLPQYLAVETAPLPRLLAAAPIERTQELRFALYPDCDQIGSLSATAKPPPGRAVTEFSVAPQDRPEDAQVLTAELPIPTAATTWSTTLTKAAMCTRDGQVGGGLRSLYVEAGRSTGATLGPDNGTDGDARVFRQFVQPPQPNAIPRAGPARTRDPEEHGDAPSSAYRNAVPRPKLTGDEFKDVGDPVAALADGDLHLLYLEAAGDVDYHRIPAPPAGAPVTVSLSHLPADADLAVYGADPSALVTPESRREAPLREAAEARDASATGDDPGETADPAVDGIPEAFPAVLEDAFGPDAPPSLQRAVLRATSVRRGAADERVEVRGSAADQGGDLIVAVRSPGGENARTPYVLRATRGEEPDAPPCLAPAAQGGDAADAGAFPSLPPSTRTLILVNRRRSIARFGATRTDAMLDVLGTYARRPEVDGAIVPVESDPQSDVNAAYAAWDDAPCDTAAAQRAAREITATIDRVAAGLDGLRNVILAGGDDVLPQVRISDRTSYANEAGYADDAAVGGRETAVSAALRQGLLLTDDPYGDFDPETAMAGARYVPDVALGRLVETPEDVVEQLEAYTRSNGRLDSRTAYVSGYDFLKDSATQIADRLEDGGTDVERRIDDTSDNAELERGLELNTGLASIGAHFSHTAAISAEAELARRFADVVDVADVTLGAGRLLLSVGCHAGLSDPDTAGGVLDWAQRSGQAGGVLVANTGFGYGDSEAVAYSERLAGAVADLLASGDVTAGQALLYGKHRFAGETLARNDFDAKASEQLTFYGLPTYRVGSVGAEARSAVHRGPAVLGRGPATAFPARVVVESRAARVDTENGSFWAEPGSAPASVAGRPLQPVAGQDVTSPLGRAHGALLTGLTSHDIPGVTPKVAAPTIDRAAQEPAREPGDVVFPQSLATITTSADTDGLSDRLLVATGRFTGNGGATGTQRLFDRVEVEVLRSSSADFTPPRIVAVSGIVEGGEVGFAAETSGADVARASVLFQEGTDGAWRRVDLAPAGDGRWTTRVALSTAATEVSEFIVQAADAAGNVGSATGKGAGNQARAVPPPSPGAATVLLEGSQAGAVFTENVTAQITGGTVDGLEVRVDAGSAVGIAEDATTTPVDGEGPHTLGSSPASTPGPARNSNARSWPRSTSVSRRSPARRSGSPTSSTTRPASCGRSSPHRSRSPGAARTPPPASRSARPPGSSAPRRPARPSTGPRSTASGDPRPQPAPPSSSTSHRPAPASRPPPTPRSCPSPNRPSRPPTGSGSPPPTPLPASPARRPSSYTSILGGAPTILAATITCEGAERRTCTGEVPPPLIRGNGIYNARVRATDRAGRETLSAPVRVTIVNPV